MDSSQRGLRSECRTDIEIMPEACGQPIRIIGMGTGRPLFLPRGLALFQNVDVFLRANVLQNFGPDAYGHFAEMRFAE